MNENLASDLSLRQTQENKEFPEVLEAYADRVLDFTKGKNLEATILPAINLCLFNFLRNSPQATEVHLNKQLQRLDHWVKKEATTLNPQNPLPTEGIEIEIPEDLRSLIDIEHFNRLIKIARRLGIHGLIDDETTIWEYKTSPSASAWTQNLLINNLIEGGFIPTCETPQGLEIMSEAVIRLNINFSIPEEIMEVGYEGKGLFRNSPDGSRNVELEIQFRKEAAIFANTLGIAFASPKRIKEASYQYAFEFGKSRGEKTIKQRKQNPNDNSSKIRRFEVRPLDIETHRIYRALAESQRLVCSFYDSIRLRHKVPQKQKATQRAKNWLKFIKESKNIFNHYNLEDDPLSTLGQPESVAQIMETTDISRQFRSILTKYSSALTPLI